ncbi:hypothetical protein [Streptomyces sp. NPDC004658]|uniref:hypothetical protein n=1 Tax=Streptomyces sp. NPDC004658 TaxID=3154672 RepID=UPI0033A9792B
MDAGTVNRELSIARKAIGWWQRQGWIVGDPTIGIERRPGTAGPHQGPLREPDRRPVTPGRRAAGEDAVQDALRVAARADEVLRLNAEDLYPQDKRGKITAKGGSRSGFTGSPAPPSCCPASSLAAPAARCSSPTARPPPEPRRSTYALRPTAPATPTGAFASPDDIEDLHGWTLHRLRHSALTHDAEDGTSAPMLLARSRHGDLAAGKSTAAARGAWLVFADEAGQSMTPPRSKTWGRVGRTPVVRVRGRGSGRMSMAGMVCYRPGARSRLIYAIREYHGRKDEPKGFGWRDLRNLLVRARIQLGGPIVLVWDNVPTHPTSIRRRASGPWSTAISATWLLRTSARSPGP